MKNAREGRQTNVSVKNEKHTWGAWSTCRNYYFCSLNMQISDVLVVVAFVFAQARNCLFSERSKYLEAVFVRHSMPEICVIPQFVFCSIKILYKLSNIWSGAQPVSKENSAGKADSKSDTHVFNWPVFFLFSFTAHLQASWMTQRSHPGTRAFDWLRKSEKSHMSTICNLNTETAEVLGFLCIIIT